MTGHDSIEDALVEASRGRDEDSEQRAILGAGFDATPGV